MLLLLVKLDTHTGVFNLKAVVILQECVRQTEYYSDTVARWFAQWLYYRNLHTCQLTAEEEWEG